MAFPFQVSEVVRPLRIDAQHAITLSFKLQRRASKTLTPAARRELAHLKDATARLDAHVAAELRPGPPAVDSRPAGRAARNAWSAMFQRLDALTRLDADVPESEAARALRDAVFPDGVAFAQGDYESLWLRGQHTLDAIAQGAHADDLERLAGDFVLRAVRGAHHALGVVLGLAGSVRAPAVEPDAPAVDRRTLLDAVTDAIARYAHQITAVDADDPAAVAEALRALEPILKQRARARSARGGVAEVTDDEPDAQDDAPPALPTTAPAANDTTAPVRRIA